MHLATYLGNQDWEGQYAGNVVGTYNVYEAARLAVVTRVVFASSENVIRDYQSIPPYSDIAAGRYDQVPSDIPMITHKQPRPLVIYGVTKVRGEALGRHFVESYGISILCVRIGRANQANRPETILDRVVYLSHRDISQMHHKCIDAHYSLGYDIFFAVSNKIQNYRDISHPRNIIGYESQESAQDFPTLAQAGF